MFEVLLKPSYKPAVELPGRLRISWAMMHHAMDTYLAPPAVGHAMGYGMPRGLEKGLAYQLPMQELSR